MSRRILTILMCVLTIVLCCQQDSILRAQLLQPQSRRGSGEQILVLTNGNVLTGLVERNPGHYSVQTPQSSRLVIANDKVDFVCDSIEQVYWGRLSRMRATDLDGQRSLFYWCLKESLFDAANNQLEVLRATGLDPKQIGFLKQHLDRSIQSETQSQRQLASSATAPSPADSADSVNSLTSSFFEIEPVFQSLPSLNADFAIEQQTPHIGEPVFKQIRSPDDPEPTEIAQVGYAEPIDPTDPTGQNANRFNRLPVHELEAFVNEFPPEVFHTFRQQVERTLIQHCSDCHGTQSPILPLLHLGKLKPLSSRMTQRNLQSAFRHINSTDSESSPLLTASIVAHGGANFPALTADSVEYQKIADWVALVNQNPSASNPTVANSPLEPARINDKQLSPANVKPIKNKIGPALVPAIAAARNGISVPPTIGEIPNLDAQEVGFQPRDDFDPEIFNRKFGGK